MPAGLYIRNANSIVQIDENYRNLVLLTKGSVPFGADWYDVTIGVPLGTVMIGLRSDRWIYVHESTIVGSGLLLTIRPGEPSAGGSIQYYAFGPAPAGAMGNCGCEIFDGSGQRVFHSDLNYWAYMDLAQPRSGDAFDRTYGALPLVCQLGISTYISMYSEVDAFISTTYFKTLGNRVLTYYQSGIVGGSYPGNYTYGQDGADLMILNGGKVY
ncbi:hypothetical protein GUH47_00070 [Xanthomonas citri pv. citri]|nr:hypothetical protein [Xanthomonas citri pv. citri]